MSLSAPTPLTPIRITPGDQEYRDILTWPFAAETFYEDQVLRLLRHDIPFRVQYTFGLVWLFKDTSGNSIGFGTLDVCKDYEAFSGGRFHCYIPLLAVNPRFQRRGHGRSIVQHLVGEAVLIAQSPVNFSDLLFLDVYAANKGAISLYQSQGFEVLNSACPIHDPQENDEPYYVMAKRVSLATPSLPDE